MTKYIANPQYPNSVIYIWPLIGSPPIPVVRGANGTITLPSGYPNDVLIYPDPQSPSIYMFVSVVTESAGGGGSGSPTSGAVWFYSFGSLDDIFNGTFQSRSLIANTYGAAGMAIQPGTGDLYIAASTLVSGGVQTSANGGIVGFTYESYSSSSSPEMFVFTDHTKDTSTFAFCSNVAFDLHGNLWLTTFDSTGDAALVCYPSVGQQGTANPGADTPYLKVVNGAAALPTTALQFAETTPGPAFPLSAPQGIAFDPLGNLWLGNSNQSALTSTLLMVSSAKLQSLLSQLTDGSLPPDPSESSAGTGFLYSLSTTDGLTLYSSGPSLQFAALLFDGFTLYVSDPYAGVVWTIALDPSTVSPSGQPNPTVLTTGEGNCGNAIFDTSPASLLIRDMNGDVGDEPDTAVQASGVYWESMDIAVTNTQLVTSPATLPTNVPAGSDSLPLSSDGTIIGSSGAFGTYTAYVYVRVANFSPLGGASTTGFEVLKVYWAASSAGLNWPTPWDGLETVTGTGGAEMIGGGLIGATPLGQIDPGNETVFQLEWPSVPDPTQYNGHFCLLARIEESSLYPFGMTFPEETNLANQVALIDNVSSNSKIAWRNIVIDAATHKQAHKSPIHIKVLGANYLPQPVKVRFGFETLNRDGRTDRLAAKIVVVAGRRALQRLNEVTFDGKLVHTLGDGRFELNDFARGIGFITLHPNETLPFEVEITMVGGVEDFAVRVVQYSEVDGVQKMVGGQTHVFGRVEGYPTR
jgi:hypothetical protein